MKPVIAALPGGEPEEYDSAEQAMTAMQAELIGQGKDPHLRVTVAIPIRGGKLALVEMSLDDAYKLDRLMRGYE